MRGQKKPTTFVSTPARQQGATIVSAPPDRPMLQRLSEELWAIHDIPDLKARIVAFQQRLGVLEHELQQRENLFVMWNAVDEQIKSEREATQVALAQLRRDVGRLKRRMHDERQRRLALRHRLRTQR